MSENEFLCRSCGGTNLELFLDLGDSPIADRLLTKEQLSIPESKFPLKVVFCHDCSLVQITETVPPEELFCQDYPYYSSVIKALLEHSKNNVLDLIGRRDLNENSFVVELASNDGYLLRTYVENGIPCLGIDPAAGPCKKAEEMGVPSLNEFFTEELALKLATEGKKADVVHANNVLAHVADTIGFVKGINILLKDEGVAVIEVPYVKELIDNCEFDTIYHQHLCYFSIIALDRLFRRNGLYLNEIKFLSIHGGSLRLYVEKFENQGESVKRYLEDEFKEGLDGFDYYKSFGEKVIKVKTDLNNLLSRLKAEGKSIAGYGAAAKGCTLINYVGIDSKTMEYIVDINPFKQGKYMTGMHQEILSPSVLVEKMPDYTLLLPWNFKDEIMSQQSEYIQNGGKFIIPIPEVLIL